jgi:hypothetical protein
MRGRADALEADFVSSGMEIELPRHGEGAVFRLTLDLDSRDGADGIMKRLAALDRGLLERLMGVFD